MGNEHREIRDGRRLCPTDTNIAVKDSNQLASEPVVLQIDRNGKNILEGEEAKSAIPWSTHDAHGISAAEAPSSFEEFAARYQNIDTFSKGLFKLGQIARGLIASASAGHKVVLGIVDASLLGTVTTWLERAGARLMAVADASDIDAGRESIAADVQLGLNADLTNRQVQASRASEVLGFGQRRLGAFLNERGMQLLDLRRQRLSKTTRLKDLVHHREPPKKWQVAELLGGDGPTPGPGALLAPQPGLLFEKGFLEVPKHYLRDAGMERFSESLWELLCRRGGALETEDAMELEWWLAGAAESEGDSGPSETSFLDSAWLEQ